jgi:transposase
MGEEKWKKRNDEVLVELSGDGRRFESTILRRDRTIAWTRLVQKGDDWFLQFTVRVPLPEVKKVENVLGIAFSLKGIAWKVIDRAGNSVAEGAMAPNEQMKRFLAEKARLEQLQRRERSVRAERFSPELKQAAHEVVNELLAVAEAYQAFLAFEDISYVQKSGPNAESNLLFSAWNYAQMERIFAYKAPLVGSPYDKYVSKVSDYQTKFTCPKCGACRKAGESDHKKATTWRTGEMLECRRCSFEGESSVDVRAGLVAKLALEKLVAKEDRQQKKQAQEPETP